MEDSDYIMHFFFAREVSSSLFEIANFGCYANRAVKRLTQLKSPLDTSWFIMTRLPLFVLGSLVVSSAAIAKFHPPRIAYENLRNGNDKDILLHALRNIGIVSITNIAEFSREILTLLPECIASKQVKVAERVFDDGTRRQTLATHTIVNNPAEAPCVGTAFRSKVNMVLQTLASSMAESMGLANEVLLKSAADDEYKFQDVFTQGEHLEHFHIYRKHGDSSNMTTVDWHIDQGIALLFAPGYSNGAPTAGFSIQLKSGEAVQVLFSEDDDLVLMLGDGIYEITDLDLHVPLHSFTMPDTDKPRVWYGRMVLPPPQALHPINHKTFEELRQKLNQNPDATPSLGCSSLTMRSLLSTDPSSCLTDQDYCWHQCFNYTEAASPEVCATEGLSLECVNSQRQLWNGLVHDPEFAPRCVNLTLVTNLTAVTDDSGQESNYTSANGNNTIKENDTHSYSNHTSMSSAGFSVLPQTFLWAGYIGILMAVMFM